MLISAFISMLMSGIAGHAAAEPVVTLPEVVVHSDSDKVLHLLAFMRDLSTMSSYTDTVTLYREKWVDFMIPMKKVRKFKGWTAPRTITSRSYYHFANNKGLDSVSSRFSSHFSYSDWIEILPELPTPARLNLSLPGSDTLHTKYSFSRIWIVNPDNVRVKMNLVDDTSNREIFPHFATFFGSNIDFDRFMVEYDYNNIEATTLYPGELTRANISITSCGRGRSMYKFRKQNEPIYVESNIDVFFLDKEYITPRQARRWTELKNVDEHFQDLELDDRVPARSAKLQTLIARVENQNVDSLRREQIPDARLEGIKVLIPKPPQTFEGRLLYTLKNLLHF